MENLTMQDLKDSYYAGLSHKYTNVPIYKFFDKASKKLKENGSVISIPVIEKRKMKRIKLYYNNI